MIIEFINRLIWYSMFPADEENHLVLINVLYNKKANAPAVCSFFWNPSEVYRLYLKKKPKHNEKKNPHSFSNYQQQLSITHLIHKCIDWQHKFQFQFKNKIYPVNSMAWSWDGKSLLLLIQDRKSFSASSAFSNSRGVPGSFFTSVHT